MLDPLAHRAVAAAEQERAPVRLGAEHHPAPAGDAGHLLDDPARVGDVLEGAVDPHRVEAVVREREGRGLGHVELAAARGVA